MSFQDDDLSFFDKPEILNFIFYPRKDIEVSKAGITCFIEVEEGIKIGCRFYLKEISYPSILYFHGNGETIGDYDYVAPLFNERGINLFVTDYRGYGLSNGMPTMTNLIKDAHPIFKGFKKIIEKEGCAKSLFLMGRSLGSSPAIELAYHYQSEISGLIIESGGADFFRLLRFFGIMAEGSLKEKTERASNKAKIRGVSSPTLVIHAENDCLIPLNEGRELYENSISPDKELFVIPGADHNNLWLVGGDGYYIKIGDFIKAHT
ncbi:MAG: alpha/beta hydrolase [Thermodesulfobacteriota bacterium]|nr:alpha/beta hydrolase [Thermodesulfobacteriota bacterium]